VALGGTTGRPGADHGFDARGYEIVANAAPSMDETDDGETVEERTVFDEGVDDRLWLIQCKRERAIGPKVLEK